MKGASKRKQVALFVALLPKCKRGVVFLHFVLVANAMRVARHSIRRSR